MTFTVEHVRRRPGAAAPPSRVVKTPQRPMSRDEMANEIVRIKGMARRLRPPLNMKPDAFHEDKSELVRAVERLEDAVRGNRPLSAAPT